MVKNTLLKAVLVGFLHSCGIISTQDACNELIKETKHMKKETCYTRTDIIILAEKLIACGISREDARFKDLFSVAQQKAALRTAYAKLENVDVSKIDAECFCYGHGAFCC
jgi:hypothetical protein